LSISIYLFEFPSQLKNESSIEKTHTENQFFLSAAFRSSFESIESARKMILQ